MLTYWLADRARWRGGRPFGRPFFMPPLAAMLMKSALRECLSVTYVTLNMVMSQPPLVAFPPLVPYGTTFPPLCGGTTKLREANIS